MYSELTGDIVFFVNGSPNTIYCIDMTTGLVRWDSGSTTYTVDIADGFFTKGVWIILEDRRKKVFIKKSINKFVF